MATASSRIWYRYQQSRSYLYQHQRRLQLLHPSNRHQRTCTSCGNPGDEAYSAGPLPNNQHECQRIFMRGGHVY
ncbi:hypothetical protein FocTR4_00014624 [Fusarium oxysporum f. sp. cubense]|uniref:Uncharacterized protein n=1 Tax=Fusarium oxysporum f. sp. cubense TaxID=61366 RepID=A0A5C6SN50_FUSOC|nr:hypothetical protein FocTR4_00014624 [Fusarium oxysporum f. sp. cubense]